MFVDLLHTKLWGRIDEPSTHQTGDVSTNPLHTKLWWRIDESSLHQTLKYRRTLFTPNSENLSTRDTSPHPHPPPPFNKLWGRKAESSSPNSYDVTTNLLTLETYRRTFLTPDSGNLSTRPIFAKLLWRIDEPSSPNSGGVSTNPLHAKLWKPVD